MGSQSCVSLQQCKAVVRGFCCLYSCSLISLAHSSQRHTGTSGQPCLHLRHVLFSFISLSRGLVAAHLAIWLSDWDILTSASLTPGWSLHGMHGNFCLHASFVPMYFLSCWVLGMCKTHVNKNLLKQGLFYKSDMTKHANHHMTCLISFPALAPIAPLSFTLLLCLLSCCPLLFCIIQVCCSFFYIVTF